MQMHRPLDRFIEHLAIAKTGERVRRTLAARFLQLIVQMIEMRSECFVLRFLFRATGVQRNLHRGERAQDFILDGSNLHRCDRPMRAIHLRADRRVSGDIDFDRVVHSLDAGPKRVPQITDRAFDVALLFATMLGEAAHYTCPVTRLDARCGRADPWR